MRKRKGSGGNERLRALVGENDTVVSRCDFLCCYLEDWFEDVAFVGRLEVGKLGGQVVAFSWSKVLLVRL